MKLSFINYASMLVNSLNGINTVNYDIIYPHLYYLSKNYLNNKNFNIFKNSVNNLLSVFPAGNSQKELNRLFKI